MRLATDSLLVLLLAASTDAAFVPSSSSMCRSRVVLRGYLDDLSKDLNAPSADPEPEKESAEATRMAKEEVDRFGPGNFQDFVDFDEFDGGDGQMGVAGDGQTGLDKSEFNSPMIGKSKMRSAKNAWGTFTGYADDLVKSGVEKQRAQQLENWQNQQEVRRRQVAARELTDNFDQVADHDEDWRQLSKFGVERNTDVDLDSEFGPVTPGDTIEGTIELTSRMGGSMARFDIPLRNEYMGFADFRAAFTPETPPDWSISPSEGSIMQREDTNFSVKFRPQNPGVSEGYLVIETEDFKKTWKVVGSTAG